jgi:hypothetical protein
MRGLPRPDLHLAFLLPDQVYEQLQRLEGREANADVGEASEDEDEDGIDAEDIRDKFGERQSHLEEHDRPSSDVSMSDSDGSQLSEYQDRRRLRLEEKDYERRQQRRDIIRKSLRIEQQAFQQSIPRPGRRRISTEDSEDDQPPIGARLNKDLDDIMRRYDERLAYVEEEERRHSQAASQLSERRLFSAQQAQIRRRARDEERVRVAAENAPNRWLEEQREPLQRAHQILRLEHQQSRPTQQELIRQSAAAEGNQLNRNMLINAIQIQQFSEPTTVERAGDFQEYKRKKLGRPTVYDNKVEKARVAVIRKREKRGLQASKRRVQSFNIFYTN